MYEVSAKLRETSGSVGIVSFQPSVATATGTVQVTVTPGPLFASASTASSDIVRGGVVGEILSFTVTPVDQYGNPVNDVVSCEATLTHDNGVTVASPTTSTLVVEVAATRCTRDAICATSAADCRYTVNYKVLRSGAYSVAVDLGGVAIKDSPRAGVTFSPTEVDATSCTMSDQGELGNEPRAGVDTAFTIQARDRFGNAVTDANSLSFSVYALLTNGLMPAPGTPGTATPVGLGAYRLTVAPEFGGNYEISVQLGGSEIGSSDFPLSTKFLPPPLSAPKSYASGAGLSNCVAGVQAEFSMQLVNTLGNFQDLTVGEKIFIEIAGPTGASIREVSALTRTKGTQVGQWSICLLYTSPSPRDATLSRMPSSA